MARPGAADALHMADERGLALQPTSVADLQSPSSRGAAVRRALLTPLQLVPFLLVPVFILARSRGWVADVPLWVLVGSVFLAQMGANVAHAVWPAGCPRPQMVIRVGVMVLGVAIAMYATGWGPVFSFGYVFAAAENIRVDGSRNARPVIVWMVVATLLGQTAIALGWVPSLVPEPQVQGVALLSMLGAALVILLLEWSTIGKERFESELTYLTMHDALTGLPNRLLLRDRLEQALERTRRGGSRVAVLFLDLDRFKNVNDSRGHDAGDALLIEIARRLEAVVRSRDMVARFGGDEFAVLCEELPADRAEDMARATAHRLCEAIAPPLITGESEILLGASIGIALATADDGPDALLRDADTAMYHAKASGPGRIAVFDNQLRERAIDRDATEHALHSAIGRRELFLAFQPIVHLRTGQCIGAEALVRWVHPDRGIVPPVEFIEIAEESGLIVPLGALVLEEAVLAAARWAPDAPEGFVVAVNISPRQLEHDEFVLQLERLLQLYAIDPRMLCFELTESALTAHTDTTLAMIRRVKSLGCSLSIDDFGTGYSSLSQFKWLPLDSVKIDRSFVAGLGRDHEDSAIVAAVLGLSRALGLRAIAEGVETRSQLDALVDMGCDVAQGYYFARPRAVGDFADLTRGLAPLPESVRSGVAHRPAGGAIT